MSAVHFLSGFAAATFFASGIFFFKFWRASKDKFFQKFGIACWLLTIERAALLLIHDAHASPSSEARSWVYIVRLFAFTLILIAIVDQNRKNK